MPRIGDNTDLPGTARCHQFGDKRDLPAAGICHQITAKLKESRLERRFCPVLFRPGFIVKLGPIPREVRDQIFHMAYEYRREGRCIGHFMVHAWTRFRYRHARILSLLCDFDLAHPVNNSYAWTSLTVGPSSAARPQLCEDGRRVRAYRSVDAVSDVGFLGGFFKAQKNCLRRSSTED